MYIPDHNNPKWPNELVKEWAGGTGEVANPEIIDFVIRRNFGDRYLEAMYLVYGCGWSQADACSKTCISSSLLSRKRKAIIREFVSHWEWRMLASCEDPHMALWQMQQVFIMDGYKSEVDKMRAGLKPDLRV